MSLWEAEIEAEHKKRKKEVKHILNPAYSWNLKMKKEKGESILQETQRNTSVC